VPSDPRGRRLRAAGLVAIAGLAGCLIVPLPEHDLLFGKGAVDVETLDAFRAGRTTRADVLLRLGEPAERRGNDRVFVYGWSVACGWIVVGFGPGGQVGQIDRPKYAAIRFDEDGVATDVLLAEDWWFTSATTVLDEWAGPDAPPPSPVGSTEAKRP
jgi:outer membrane protein assembly factor BamE (lipoprotein component of BamABCDE complex)